MRVTRTLPMCGAAAAVAELELEDLVARKAEGRSSDDERRLCTISGR